jgi:uncharacterized protein (TIGR02996 family)
MPRYQLGNDICSIDQVDHKVVIVEDGISRVEECTSVEMARTRFRILANQKLRAKWKPIADAPEAALIVEAVVQNARNPELEAALLEDPESVSAWQVYGDWLQQQGDPRGTHIALRKAVLAAPKDLRAAERLRQYEDRHAKYLRGGLPEVQVGWGFLDVVRLNTAEQLAVLSADAGRFIRRIEVPYATGEQLAAVIDAIGHHSPRTLRELAIESHTLLRSVKPIDALLPRLRVLDLECNLERACIEQLATVPFPHLVELGISTDLGSRSDLVALLTRPGLDRVVSLRLYDQATVDVCGILAGGPLAAKLEKLMIVDHEWSTIRSLLTQLERGRFPRLGTLQMDLEAMYSRTIQKLVSYVGNVENVPDRFATVRDEQY